MNPTCANVTRNAEVPQALRSQYRLLRRVKPVRTLPPWVHRSLCGMQPELGVRLIGRQARKVDGISWIKPPQAGYVIPGSGGVALLLREVDGSVLSYLLTCHLRVLHYTSLVFTAQGSVFTGPAQGFGIVPDDVRSLTFENGNGDAVLVVPHHNVYAFTAPHGFYKSTGALSGGGVFVNNLAKPPDLPAGCRYGRPKRS